MAVRTRKRRGLKEKRSADLYLRGCFQAWLLGAGSLLATLQDAAEEGIQQILRIRAEHRAGEAGRESMQCSQAFHLNLLACCLEHLQERP